MINDKVILHSMHMRAMITGLSKEFQSIKSVKYIYDKLVEGEKKFLKHFPKRYDELDEIKYQTAVQYNRVHKNVCIATDTAITELYHSQQEGFQRYFKLKEKRFGQLFQRFGHDDDLEESTLELMFWLSDEIDRCIAAFEFRKWIAENQKRINDA